MKILVLAAHIADTDDKDAVLDAMAAAMKPLKAEGTTGTVALFDLGSPQNADFPEVLDALDLSEAAKSVRRVLAKGA